jgi:homoserine kinase
LIKRNVTVRAPASIANLGSGFDVMAVAIEGFYDLVKITALPGDFKIQVESDGFGVPSGEENLAYHVAKRFVEKYLKRRDIALYITVKKGVPPGSGLGSSGATSAAVAYGLNALFDLGLKGEDLLELAGYGEAFVAGAPHYDNVAASLLGGFVFLDLIEGKVFRYVPRESIPIGIVFPRVPGLSSTRKTAYARSILPRTIDLETHVKQSSALAKLIYGIFTGNLKAVGEAISHDLVVEPHRAKLIPHYYELKQIALSEGAYGFNICGAGPSVFLIHEDLEKLKTIVNKLRDFLRSRSFDAEAYVTSVSIKGAEIVEVV